MMMIMATMMIMMIRRMVGQVHITAPPLMVIKGGQPTIHFNTLSHTLYFIIYIYLLPIKARQICVIFTALYISECHMKYVEVEHWVVLGWSGVAAKYVSPTCGRQG